MVNTDALADNSHTNECNTHKFESNGYLPGPFQMMYVSNGRPKKKIGRNRKGINFIITVLVWYKFRSIWSPSISHRQHP